MSSFTDQQLGMDRNITRRDFINGAATAIGAAFISHPFAHAQAAASAKPAAAGYYPPTATGMRGCHTGAFEAAHSLRDGTFWKGAAEPVKTGETYDLVVVGGGISGLAAAHAFLEQAGPSAKVLILDNHDDFGGHAKRNEFEVGSVKLLGYGGSCSIQSPGAYSATTKKLLFGLGVDLTRYASLSDSKLYPSLGLKPKVFFDQETFGADKLALDPHSFSAGPDQDALWKQFVANSALPEQANADLQNLYTSVTDYLDGKNDADKKTFLASTSYADYLANTVKVDPAAVAFMQSRLIDLYGTGIEAIPAQDAWGLGMPGFSGLKLQPAPGSGMGRHAQRSKENDGTYFHFPDGNASLARLLVRKLIPAAVSGSTAEDIVTAQVQYDKLDETKSNTRIRLSSTVVRVQHVGNLAAAQEVEIVYTGKDKLSSVHGKYCILACWNTVIPFITAELSADQKTALAAAEKIPLVYANVVLKNWQSFAKLDLSNVYAPTSYWTSVALDERVSIGGYRATTQPDEPIVIQLRHIPCTQGLPSRSQHRAGRAELYSTTFDTLEHNLRDQLARILSPGGFDPAKDIAAITINRWGHGRTYQYNSLWDPYWKAGGSLPCVAARKPYGRVAIANADSDAYAYFDAAIDQGYRAVADLHLKANA
jgi:spermidine dehydrogenase